MRLIKLGVGEFPSPSDVHRFFQGPTSELRQRGFLLPKGWISPTGLQPGELVLFSYRAIVLYVAQATSARQAYTGPESAKYPYRFNLDLQSLRPANVTVQKLERTLRQEAGQRRNIASGRGWARLPSGDAAQALVEQLVSKSLPWIDDDGVEEGLKEDKTVAFRRRNALVIAQRREKDGNACQACGFCFAVKERYIIDCHHLFPMRGGVRVTHISDLVCLCPTCHRIAHARRPPFTVLEIRTLRGTVAAAQPGAQPDRPEAALLGTSALRSPAAG